MVVPDAVLNPPDGDTTAVDGLVADVDWRRPDDVVDREVDPESGMLATPYCPTTRGEVFVAGTEPQAVCALHAGSGEPSPFWSSDDDSDEEMVAETTTGPQKPATAEEQRRKKERERGMRGLLRRIFGGD